MDRINGAGHVNRMFVTEDIATNRPPTEVTAEWLNTIQEEIAHVIEAGGVTLDPADNTQLYTRIAAMITAAMPPAAVGRKPGEIFVHAGTTAPAGALVCPVAQTNVSRTTYAALFNAIGTTWGAGDGATTFGLPWLPPGYAILQASGNVGAQTIGQVIAHTHTVPFQMNSLNGGGSGSVTSGGLTTTSTTGGSANLAAGVHFLICVQYQ
ncbi:MAG: phage tail protein [Gallionella sp.]|nr:phage tail protein [Gallionella sp.]MDD4947453.1 phage tail protein [Gallionella sp.]